MQEHRIIYLLYMVDHALRENCPYLEFSWYVFSRIRTEHGPENSEYGHFLRSDIFVFNPFNAEKL